MENLYRYRANINNLPFCCNELSVNGTADDHVVVSVPVFPSFYTVKYVDQFEQLAIDRAKAYVDAGADAIFPEAMLDEREFAAFRSAIEVPLLANITEFGKTPLLSAKRLADLGYNIAIFPATTLRLAMGAVRAGLAEIAETGTQAGMLDRMLTRAELYELIRYEDYRRFDKDIFFDFEL